VTRGRDDAVADVVDAGRELRRVVLDDVLHRQHVTQSVLAHRRLEPVAGRRQFLSVLEPRDLARLRYHQHQRDGLVLWGLDVDQRSSDLTRQLCSRHVYNYHTDTVTEKKTQLQQLHRVQLDMRANAQHDGRPAEHRWRPLFNAAKFG